MIGIGLNQIYVPYVSSAAPEWWEVDGYTTLLAYKAVGVATLAESKINLANPGTNDLTDGDVAPPTMVAGGWSFTAGSTQALHMTVSPAFATTTLLIHCANDPLGISAIGGQADTTNSLYLRQLSGKLRWYNGALGNISSTFDGPAVTGWAGLNLYKDGADIGDIHPAIGFGGIYPYIGAYNSNGTENQYYTGIIGSLILIDGVLTQPLVAALSTTMAELT